MSEVINATGNAEPTDEKKDFQPGNKLIIGIVLGVITYWLFSQTLLNIGNDIQKTINIGSTALNMAISLSALFCGCFVVLAGGIADKFGCVKLTYIGLALSIIGSLCLILAAGQTVFIIGRILQGLSAACIMPASLAIIKEYYKGKERQRAVSFWSMGSWGGSGVASLAGGTISTYMGWKWIFIISIICCIVAFFLISGTPETKKAKDTSRFDISGLIFFLISIISLNIIITQGSKLGWTSLFIICLIIVCLISFIIFFKVETDKKKEAFIDFSLFKNKLYSGATFSNFMLNAVAGALIVVSSYVQSRGFSSFETGMLTIGYLVSVLLMIRVGEKIMQRAGAKRPMLSGSFTCGFGIGLMSLTFLSNVPYLIVVFIGFILYGTGLGIYATPSTDTAVSNTPNDKAGIGSGIYKMASSLGGGFGIAISTSVVAATLALYDSTVASTIGLLTNVLFCVLSFIAVLIMVPDDYPTKKQ